jgi:ParB/RepB/Spo0J family partition protein
MLVLPESVQYPTAKVFPDQRNKRRDLNLASILPAIREQGILNPLIGWASGEIGVFAIAGHRRLGAAQELGLKTIPIRIFPEEPPASTVALIRAMENFTQAELRPSEKAREIKELIETHGLLGKHVAVQLGTSEGSISRLRALLDQPPDIIELCDTGRLPLSVVATVSRIPDELERRELVRKFQEEGWSRERMEHAVQERTGKRKFSPRGGKVLFKAGQTSVSLAGGTLTEWSEALTALLRKIKSAVAENLDTAAFATTLKNGGTKHV